MLKVSDDGYGGNWCQHPDPKKKGEYVESTIGKGEFPNWCPLKKEPITITLEQ